MPRFAVAIMRMLPLWRSAKAVAHTLRYDFATLAGLQQGRPIPAERWAGLTAPTIVMVGSKSEAFFHATAKTLAKALPAVEYESLEGAHHGSPEMSPAGIAHRIIERFASA